MLPIITRLVVLVVLVVFRHPVLPDSDLIIRDLDWAVIKLSPCSSLHLQYRHIHVPCLKQIVRCCKIGENSRSKALCIPYHTIFLGCHFSLLMSFHNIISCTGFFSSLCFAINSYYFGVFRIKSQNFTTVSWSKAFSSKLGIETEIALMLQWFVIHVYRQKHLAVKEMSIRHRKSWCFVSSHAVNAQLLLESVAHCDVLLL